MKALSKSPDARFESAKHFQRALATAYLSAGLELPKSPEEIETQSWNTMNQSASADTFGGLPQSGNAWPIPDSTALPNQRLFDSEQGIYKGLDSAANRPDHLRQSNAVQTGEQLHNRNALNESQAAQSNTDQHPIRKDIPDNPKAIHRNSDLHNIVREDFVTFDSAQYEIGCLGEDSGEWDDEDDDFEDQLAINRSYRPLLVLFAILIAGGLWGLLVISSWNESKRTTSTLLPQVGAGCGNTVKTWKKGAVRLLILPLLPRNANRPHSPIRAKRFAALKQIQQNIQNHLQKAAHPLHHDFLSIHVSAMGFSQVDPTLNRARARMYGELCKADIVLSGGWFDAGNNTQLQPTSTKNGVDKAFWIRMFSTFTGKRLFAKHNKKQVFLPTPPDIDELVRSNAVQLPGPRLRHFIQGLVRLRAANIMSESLFLSPHLLVRAFDSFRQAGTLNPAQLPLVAQLKQRNMKQRETVFVPAGTFWMNKNNQLIKQHLPNFWIDKYEVSREEYAICVLKGQCPAVRNFLSASWSLPRDRVTTKAARTFCKQEGKTLPTEEQWIKAARGGIVLNGKPNPYPKRQYTWGKPDSFPKGQQTALCQLTHVFKCYRALVEGDLVATMISTHRHLKGISPYGAHHMHGNASELLDNGSIKGGDGYGLLHPISWKGHMDQRDGLSWVGFRCVRAK
jgi:formylglycine-generating enzyme required for sulfatase activity